MSVNANQFATLGNVGALATHTVDNLNNYVKTITAVEDGLEFRNGRGNLVYKIPVMTTPAPVEEPVEQSETVEGGGE